MTSEIGAPAAGAVDGAGGLLAVGGAAVVEDGAGDAPVVWVGSPVAARRRGSIRRPATTGRSARRSAYRQASGRTPDSGAGAPRRRRVATVGVMHERTVRATIASGTVEGFTRDGVNRWRSIPYARPPVGPAAAARARSRSSRGRACGTATGSPTVRRSSACTPCSASASTSR